MVKMPRFETSCLETGIKTLATETGQQLPPSIDSTDLTSQIGTEMFVTNSYQDQMRPT